MARTAPVPDIPPIPGMCPSIAVLAGGGDGGGGSGGDAGSGDGDNNAGGSGSGEEAPADKRGAPDTKKYPECGFVSHPVDVVTGRAFTHPITDVFLPGPLPLVFQRMYSSPAAGRDMGLGHGWAHSFSWTVEIARRHITVWNEQGVGVDFALIPAGSEVLGPWGWVLRREAWGFAVDAGDGLWRLFSFGDEARKHFRLTAIEDANKNRIALTYTTENGHLVEIKDSAGRLLHVQSTAAGRIAAIHVQGAVPQGERVAFAAYTYDDEGCLVAVTDADGFTARYAYDDRRLTADIDKAGLAFHFRYDDQGRCVEAWGDHEGGDPSLAADLPTYLHDGHTRAKGIHHAKLDFFPDGYTEVADSTQIRRYFGNARGTLDKSVVGAAVTTVAYRDDGHLLSRTDALGAHMTYDRDARGRVTRFTDGLGRVTVIERDASGLPVQVVDPAGGITRLERDRFGNVLVFTDATGAVTSFRYGEHGLVTEMVTAEGGRVSYEYDEHANRVTVKMPNGGVRRYRYDAFGRRVAEVDPLGAETHYAYSRRGDLVSLQDAAGGVTRFMYDGEGHLVRVADAKGRVVELTWGGYNKLCGRKDANGNEVRLRYNREGELVSVHNEKGEVHLLHRDAAGKLTGETTFDGRQIHYRRDRLGRPIQITNGLGQKTGLTYDLAGQLVARELPDGTVESFEYSPRGDVVVARSPAAECLLERDAMGRIVRELQQVADSAHTVEIAYDAVGSRASRATSLGHTEAIVREALGARRRVALAGNHAFVETHDVLGREIARDLPGGGRVETLFDPLGRVARRRSRGPARRRAVTAQEPEWIGASQDEGVLIDTAYRYDWDGELIETWDRERGRTEYRYDPVGSLLFAGAENAQPEQFRYDIAGNLFGGEPREYGPGNRLLCKGDASFVWDDDGRLVEKRVGEATWRYAWNAAGLLSSAEAPNGTLTDCTYDAFGRRMQKRVSRRPAGGRQAVPVSHVRFVWDGDVLVHEIKTTPRHGGDPVVEERTYCFEEHGFSPLAHRDVRHDEAGRTEGPWFHYVNDSIGAPLRLVSADGQEACELRRSAWGHAEVTPDSRTRTPLRFPGQYEDEETGLCYNRWRYYDPDLGAFIAPDRVGLDAGVHFYRYAKNPVGASDPLGLSEVIHLHSSSTSSQHRKLHEFDPGRAYDGTPEKTEFIYDPDRGTFVTGYPERSADLSPHQHLAVSAGISPESRGLVGGMVWRDAQGKLHTNENSGHFGKNWDQPGVREEFRAFVAKVESEHQHQEWERKC